MNTATDFFNDISEDERNAASANLRVGGGANPFTVGEPVEVTITGPITMEDNGGIEEVEAKFTITAADGRTFDVALGTTVYLGDKAEIYAEAKGTPAEKRTEDQKKTMKYASIGRSKLHSLLAAGVPSYETRILEKVGKKWVASDMDGNPMDKEQRDAAEVTREAKLNRVLAAWSKGERLDILNDVKVVYTPSENKKNADFPYHNFSAI